MLDAGLDKMQVLWFPFRLSFPRGTAFHMFLLFSSAFLVFALAG